MVKRVGAILVWAVVAVVALSACGDGGGASDATSATGPIDVWLSNNEQEIAWGEKIIEQWNRENPDQEVSYQEIPAGESSEAVIQAAITAGNAPCLIWNVAPAAVPQFQRAGGLVALDSFEGGVDYARERLGGRLDQYVSPDGQLYQMPWKSNPVMIIYNKELFEQAGIDPENPPLATYEEFFRTAQTLNEELGIAAIWPSADQTFFQAWFDYYPTFIAASGGEQLVENGEAQFNSDVGVQVGEFWRSLYDAGLIPRESAPGDAFGEEQSAMSIVGPWAVAVYEDIDWGVVPVPTPEGTPSEEIYTFSDAKSTAIFTACENQRTAFEFMKFATSEEADRMLLEETGQMPLRDGLMEIYGDYFDQNPLYATFAEQAERTVEVPNVENSIEMWQRFRDAYTTAVIFGREPVSEAFSAAARDIEELVGKSGQ